MAFKLSSSNRSNTKQASIQQHVAVVGLTVAGAVVSVFGFGNAAEARLAAANLAESGSVEMAVNAKSEPCDHAESTVLGEALGSIEAGGQKTSPLAQASVLVGAVTVLAGGGHWLKKNV